MRPSKIKFGDNDKTAAGAVKMFVAASTDLAYSRMIKGIFY